VTSGRVATEGFGRLWNLCNLIMGSAAMQCCKIPELTPPFLFKKSGKKLDMGR